jgi:hypothetical protein
LLETQTLLAPDLELRPFGAGSRVIAVVEGIIGFCLLFGVYARAAAAGLRILCVTGLVLFGSHMLGYIGLVGGAAVYLLLQGAGAYSLPLPAVPGTGKIAAWLARQLRERAQWLLRMLAGLNLVYLGLQYKFLQPNLMIGIIELHQVPTFGFNRRRLYSGWPWSRRSPVCSSWQVS